MAVGNDFELKVPYKLAPIATPGMNFSSSNVWYQYDSRHIRQLLGVLCEAATRGTVTSAPSSSPKRGLSPCTQATIISGYSNSVDLTKGMTSSAPRIAPQDLSITPEALGSGAFATVYKGRYVRRGMQTLDAASLHEALQVAVKTPHSTDRDSIHNVYREIDVMQGLQGNPHILHLLGHSLQNEAPVLVLEYCANGDLQTFLREELALHKEAIRSFDDRLELNSNNDFTLIDLIGIAWQISDGMIHEFWTFLSSKAYIHRDLAARNILLTSNMVAKIADFGLSRLTHEEVYYAHYEKVKPTKWMAPESLANACFSTQSDV
ncbi:fibroblast growth factor receptor 1 [Aphelenchoides avenae]|nr:fibroblast growth factor receptor 1 [Aphelenchus avenae]